MAENDDDVGVLPSHLQPLLSLMRPSTGEIAAAQATGPSGNPALLGAYWLQRMGGLQEARGLAEQSQRDNMSIARQKLANARQKSLLDFFKGEPVVSRLENPNAVWAATTGLPIQSPGMDDASRRLLQARIFALMQRGQGSTGEQTTEKEVTTPEGTPVFREKTVKRKGAAPAAPNQPSAPQTGVTPEQAAAIQRGTAKGIKFEQTPNGIKWSDPKTGRSGMLP